MAEPKLTVRVWRSTERYRFLVESPADSEACRFSDLVALFESFASVLAGQPTIEPGVDDDVEPVVTSDGTLEWVLEYAETLGDGAQNDTWELLFSRSNATQETALSAAAAFAARLLQEPDVDEPCFSEVEYTMTVDAPNGGNND